jgi:diguanylate cyclase (GGDEF)-like protein
MSNINPYLVTEDSVILIVSAMGDHLDLLSQILAEDGYEITIFREQKQEAHLTQEEERPDLILIDGLESYKIIQDQIEDLADLPLVFLIHHDTIESLIESCQAVIFDYIILPINPRDVSFRISKILELKILINQVEELLSNNQQLTQKVELFANRDELTHVLNRRYFLSLAYQELQRSRRYERAFGILILDLDNFKEINEKYGHALGDQVLQAIAKNINQCLRSNDLLGRFGGEEFVILLPETDLEKSQKVGQRICNYIANLGIPLREDIIQVTVSIGVSSYHEADSSFEDILKRAEQALSEAKAKGRNQVIIYP